MIIRCHGAPRSNGHYAKLAFTDNNAHSTPVRGEYLVHSRQESSNISLKELTSENFKELLAPYFIAVHYLQELWIQNKFNLIITDNLTKYYGKDIKLEGFIRHNDIPDIYIKAKTSRHHRTGILLHEISHQIVCLVSKQKNVRIAPHGPLFKKHLKLLFAPLLKDRTYYRKHNELSYHLAYEATRFTPTKDMCV